MGARAAKLMLSAGAVAWGAAFVAFVVGSHREVGDDLAIVGRMGAGAADGRRAYERHHCGACHSILGAGAGYAPDLTRASQRLGGDAIRARLHDGEPRDEGRKMPRKPLTRGEIDGLVDYLSFVARLDARERPPRYTRERVAAALRRAAPSPEPGAALLERWGCLGCHAIGDRGERRAPRLEEIAARDDARFVAQYLAHPAQFAPWTSMPPCAGASITERLALGEFVASLTR